MPSNSTRKRSWRKNMAIPKVGAILELDTSNARKQLKSLEKSSVDVSLQIKNINTLKQLLNKKFSLEADERSFQNAQKRIDEITRAIANIRNQMQSISSSKVLDVDTKKTWISQLKNQIKSLQAEKVNLQVDKRELSDAHKEYQKIENQIKKLNNEKLNLKGDSSDVDKINKELQELYAKQKQIDQDTVDIQLQLDNYNQVMSQLNSISNMTKRIQNLGKSMNSVGKSMTNIFSGVSNNPIGKFTHFLTQGIGYSSLYRLTSSFMNTIESSFSGAINRMDTIANANRTFQAMSFDTKTIDSSIADLENRILGLPTTLNDAMQSVTMISSITNDLPRAVRIFDAFNNAILAFGGNQEQANRAITQFSQAMGTGKVDARTYLSLTDAGMSPALAKVAEMLGYSSENMGEFKSALGEGEISIEEFTDALIKLNENGYDTMKALNALAKENALKSIGSSITVMETQIQKGWASIIQSINDTLVELGYGSIPENIAKFGEYIKGRMVGLSIFINQNRDTIGKFLDYIIEKFNDFRAMLSKFDFGSFLEGLESFKWVADSAKDALEFFFNTFKGMAEYFGGGDVSKGLGRMAGGYLTLAYGLRIFGSALSFVAGPFGKFAEAMTLFNKSGKFTNFASKFSGLSNIFTGKGSKDKKTGTTTPNATFSKDALLNSLGNQLNIALVAGQIMLYAEAIKQLNEKIPDNIGQVVPKLALLAGTMAGFNAIVIGLSKLGGNGENIAGQLMTLGIMAIGALELVAFAEVMKQIDDRVPDDLGNVIAKFATMLGVITAFIAFCAGVGAFAATGVGTAVMAFALLGELIGIIAGAGLWAMTATFAGAVGELEKICESLNRIGEIKINGDRVDKNLEEIFDATESMSEYAGNIFNAIGKIINLQADQGIFAQATSNIDEVLSFAKILKKFKKYDIKKSDVKRALDGMEEAIEALNGFSVPTLATIDIDFTDLKEKIKGIPGALKVFAKISEYDVSKVNYTTVKNALSTLKDCINTLNENKPPAVQKSLTTEGVQDLAEYVGSLNSVLEAFAGLKIPENLDEKNVSSVFEKVYDLITTMRNTLFNKQNTILTLFSNFKVKASDVENVAEVINKIGEIATAFANLPPAVSEEKIEAYKESLSSIAEVLQGFYDRLGAGDTLEGYVSRLADTKDAFNDLVGEDGIFTALVKVANKLKTLQETMGTLNFGDDSPIFSFIHNLREVISRLSGEYFQQVLTDDELEENMESISKAINKLIKINEKLMSIQGAQFDINLITAFIDNLQTIITKLSSITGTEEASSMVTAINKIIEQVKEMVATLGELNQSFYDVAVSWGESTFNGWSESGVIDNIIATVDELMETMSGKDFYSIGNKWGASTASGFSAGIQPIYSAVSNVASTLSRSTAFSSAGASLGSSFASAFNSAVSNLDIPDIPTEHDSKGGKVPTKYYAKGGFTRKGTDTIPAMLTPGEFVIRKKAVDKVGVPFLRKINSMNLKGAFKSLMSAQGNQSMQATYNHVVNNTSNYNYGDRSVTINGGNERQQRLKANKFMKGLAY